MPFLYFDSTYILIIPALIFSLIAQNRVTSTFNKYSKFRNRRGLTGREVAELILRNEGVRDVAVGQVAGQLSDHYNPRTKMVNLSQSVYNSTSVAALGIAAHECGHAIQHNRNYIFIQVRDFLLPTTNFAGKMAMPLFFVGMILGSFIGNLGYMLTTFAILAYAVVVLFQVVTLPVEFDASNRAKKLLVQYGYLDDEEISHVRRVLSAAAMTYVAAAAMGLLQLLRLILLSNRRRD